MQNRFKLRIWDDDNECFDYLDFNDLEKVKHTIDNYNEYFWSGYFKEKPQYLMQCTGMKDKNGKLIYEGDIIQIPDDYDTYGMFAGEKRVIYFNEGGFRLKPKWDKNARGNWLEDTEDFEVIGNIYENKSRFCKN